MSLGECPCDPTFLCPISPTLNKNTAAYGMFNVWLPTVLEARAKKAGAQGLDEALREYVV
jgi:hypothetical protein